MPAVFFFGSWGETNLGTGNFTFFFGDGGGVGVVICSVSLGGGEEGGLWVGDDDG